MRRSVYKLFWAWNFDNEEGWLNEMAAKGLALVAVGLFRYTFEEALPGEYNIRLELLDNFPTHAESENYIKFLEETGAEYLGSVTRWVYFRKRTDSGEFNLFSDNNSRIKHLNRSLLLLGILALTNFIIGISNILTYFNSSESYFLSGGILCLCVGLLLGYGYLRVHVKKSRLKKEQMLFE